MQEDKDRYLLSGIKSFTYNDEIYACPRSVETMVIYYNQDLLKYPFEFMEDYYNFAKEIRSQGKYGIISKWDTIYYAYGFLSGFGGYCFKQKADGTLDPNDIGLDNECAVRGAEYLRKFIDNTAPSSIFGDDGFAEIDKLFVTGQVAAVITGPWALDDYAKSGLNYGVAPLPKFPNGKYAQPFLGYRGYAVTRNAKDVALAEKFLRFINQDKFALKRYENIHEIPPLKSIMHNPLILNDDFASAVAIQALHAEPTPSIPEMAKIWEPMNNALYEAMTTKGSIKVVLIKSSLECLCFHKVRVNLRTMCKRTYTSFKSLHVAFHDEVPSVFFSIPIAEFKHFLKFPLRVNVHQGKRRTTWCKRFFCQTHHNA